MLASMKQNKLYMQSVQNGCGIKQKKLKKQLNTEKNSWIIKDYT
jgi:hypothetical protein